MYVNGAGLLLREPIRDMIASKKQHEASGTSYGLSELGYDITLKQDIEFFPSNMAAYHQRAADTGDYDSPLQKRTAQGCVYIDGEFYDYGQFALASSIEYFEMPTDMGAEVKDKSTMARKALQVFNTVIEPGWEGYLTLELAYWGQKPLKLYAGQGIAQVLFQCSAEYAKYNGKYQNQPDRPVEAR